MAPVPPHTFPSNGFEIIDPSLKIEEETLSFYDPRLFYPVRIGEVFQERYQIITKLGWGAHSTIWLCHDLHNDLYRSLKIHINTLQQNRELQIYQHLKNPALEQSEHGGKEHLRELYDSFRVKGPYGTHDVFILRPLGTSIRDLQKVMPDGVFDVDIVPEILLQILPTVHFLHTEANITHTDIHTGNLLEGIQDEQLLVKMLEDELGGKLCPRKDAGDRTVYATRYFRESIGNLYLCDLGEAVVGDKNTGPAMPTQYRAPEIILGMKWGHAIDMWSIGMMVWDMMQPADIFKIYNREDEFLNNAYHLASMIALLGPPPREFLEQSQESSKYWDKSGNWRDIVPIPTNRTLEDLATKPQDKEERDLFINFVSGLLCWLPEDRLDSFKVFSHLWIYRAMEQNQ
ncbi:hypothetical protein Daus18300_013648 [Diaporthe australafricana]|uniref:non-specific serine/threonine protein kinase n=1 Tax=Diaporthe australafricana TaxID=127596 RepID=A0ABR3VY83_9PEZI